ncbi:MAG: YggS family pyridoxal phosphate-dependent enzyme, partial [Elusimicrobia bacterium]|nr:YggS family pyridoxal phosphate-dependent enzyme [Elusimicrobiota bacterium]MBD3412328.1 YggS family pyridoxal phosphate-dependent enzyme [Elusimicrobiota bacterium]
SINRHAGELHKIQSCLVEVNIAAEQSKYGIEPDRIEELLRAAEHWPHITIQGLMAIAPYDENPESARPYFKTIKNIFDAMKEKSFSHSTMRCLSIGMSNDFQVAIEEGATMVRIGTALFGERTYH